LKVENEEANIWMDNVLDALRICRRDCREALSASAALAILNMAVLRKDPENTLRVLRNK
jgi:hypothetical protein